MVFYDDEGGAAVKKCLVVCCISVHDGFFCTNLGFER